MTLGCPEIGDCCLCERSLLRRKSVYSKGGNPNVLKRKTKRRLRGIRLEVEELMDELDFQWAESMKGVDIHAFTSAKFY